MVGFSGESGNFDGNGSYTRFQSAGGGYKVQTPPIGSFSEGLLRLGAAAAARDAAARGAEAALQAGRALLQADAPDLNAAQIGAGP